MPDSAVDDVVSALEEKLPGHTFRAVMGRADALEDPAERAELLASILEDRKRSEELPARKKRATSDVSDAGGRSSAAGTG